MTLLIEALVESSAILLVALAAATLLRKQPAALRHWVLAVAFACVALTPAIAIVAPSWELPGAQLTLRGTAAPAATPAAASSVNAPSVSGAVERALPARGPSIVASLLTIWIAGALAGLALLAIGFSRLARLASRSREISDGVWAGQLRSICGEERLARPVRLLASSHPSLLVTWGAFRPQVILPAAAREWRPERVDIVLRHELAHIQRSDWLVQLAAEVLKCVFWFNPVVWLACARLRRESEQACDDAVLARGVDGPSYARHLVEIARDLKQGRIWMPAAAIARPSSLERRVRAMLDTHLNRRPVSRLAAAAALVALVTITIPLAGFAAQTVFASLKGTVLDPSNSAVPGATLVLTNAQTQAKYEVRSDDAGRYEFVGLVPGDYLFEAKLPGFVTLQGRLTLSGQAVQQDVKLQIGSLQETVTVASSRSATPVSAPALAKPLPKRPLSDCTTAQAGTGGHIRPPRKLRDVRPVYPVSMSSPGIEGTVTLDARIGTDGLVEEVKVVSAPHADLGNAAADAVRDWVFDETLLNCVPVSVPMKVTVNFTLDK